jgi:hypothetical protein
MAVVATPYDIEKADARAFRVLFRRENSYIKMARSVTSPEDPKAHLDLVIPQQFNLSIDDSASLKKQATG